MKKIIWPILLVVFIVNVSSCSKSNRDAHSAEGEIPSQTIVPIPANIYPHTEVFKVTSLHGEVIIKAGEAKLLEAQANGQKCKSCHGDKLEGGVSKKSCRKCHADFPHTKGFLATNEHGTKYLQNYGKCISCHKPNLSKKMAKADCMKCHNYPHKSLWAHSKNHGPAFKNQPKDNKVKCSTCHEKGSQFNRRNPSKFVACDSCHTMIPHSKQFMASKDHGKQYLKDKASCLKCHKMNLADKSTKAKNKCLKCHSYPHYVNWGLAQNHGKEFKSKKQSCDKCHQKGSKFSQAYSKQFVACDSCHIMQPHENDKKFLEYFPLPLSDEKNEEFYSDTHMYSENAKSGGKYAMKTQYKGNCASCHKDYFSNNDTCNGCHDRDEETYGGILINKWWHEKAKKEE